MYKDVWDAIIGNELQYEREGQNSYYQYAVCSSIKQTMMLYNIVIDT